MINIIDIQKGRENPIGKTMGARAVARMAHLAEIKRIFL